MNRTNTCVTALATALALMSCTLSNSHTPVVHDDGGIAPFTLPAIPRTLRDPHSRADYLVAHYWDHTSWADTAITHRENELEQFFVDWLSILPYVNDQKALAQAISQVATDAASSADTATVSQLWDLAFHYLYDSSSPLLDEQQYLHFVTERIYRCKDEAERMRLEDQRRICLKNRPGEPAPDFGFLLSNGKPTTLYKTLQRLQGQVLLLFYDPDCQHCMETVHQLSASTLIAQQIASRELTILAIDTEGADSSWKQTLSLLPDTWQRGLDTQMQILIDDLYTLRAMPTLLLIDQEGTILVKNISVRQLTGE